MIPILDPNLKRAMDGVHELLAPFSVGETIGALLGAAVGHATAHGVPRGEVERALEGMWESVTDGDADASGVSVADDPRAAVQQATRDLLYVTSVYVPDIACTAALAVAVHLAGKAGLARDALLERLAAMWDENARLAAAEEQPN